jgi:hypothetical protein
MALSKEAESTEQWASSGKQCRSSERVVGPPAVARGSERRLEARVGIERGLDIIALPRPIHPKCLTNRSIADPVPAAALAKRSTGVRSMNQANSHLPAPAISIARPTPLVPVLVPATADIQPCRISANKARLIPQSRLAYSAQDSATCGATIGVHLRYLQYNVHSPLPSFHYTLIKNLRRFPPQIVQMLDSLGGVSRK